MVTCRKCSRHVLKPVAQCWQDQVCPHCAAYTKYSPSSPPLLKNTDTLRDDVELIHTNPFDIYLDYWTNHQLIYDQKHSPKE